jgi:MSHA biogenesis protein MshM
MYEQYYGLLEKPFDLTPDTDFYCQTLTHQEALNVLLVAIKSGDGFIKLTGEVGTGKTLLCRKLLDLLDDSFETIYIPNPYMSCAALLKAVAEEMGLPGELSDDNYLSAINQRLIENAQAGRKTVILLDEAQSLPVESLEAIRLLSNLETEKTKLVQIVLFGQPELDHKLTDNSIRQLQQRIVHAFQLRTLSAQNTAQYVRHRLKAAGYFGPDLFDQGALKLLYKKTRGVPRLINLISNKALLLAFSDGSYFVTSRQVRMAADDSQQTRVPLFRTAGVLRQTALLMLAAEFMQQLLKPLL